jgi:hypothetical protein
MPPREATRQARQGSALLGVDAPTCGRAKDVQFLILATVASLVSGTVFVWVHIGAYPEISALVLIQINDTARTRLP